jgi:EmrB/QacA subfamily drug resistance transporter
VSPGFEARRRLTLAATILGSSLAFIDATVVVVALPRIEEDLGLGLSGQQWVYLSYSLALAALYLPAGAIGDRMGRRRAFAWGAVGFALASALAGFAPSEAVLLVARTLQGVAGAFLTTNSLALIRATFGPESGRAIGLWTAWTGVATIAGPPAGGALVEWASWRWIFFLNLPLAAVTIWLAHAGRCEEQADERQGRLDLPGAVTAAIAFGTVTYGVVQGAENGFGRVWWAFAIAAVSFAAFIAIEHRTAAPMLPLGLFRGRNFAAANLETFALYAALGGTFFYLTLYLQFIGFTPFEAGLASIPTSVVMILLAARFGRLADRHGPRLYLTAGPLLFGAGTLLFLPVEDISGFWAFGVPGYLLLSLGLAMFVAPITATALSSVSTVYAGVASGVNSTISRLGNLLAVAVLGLVVALVFGAGVSDSAAVPLAADQTDPELRAASIDAFRAAMLGAAALAFAGAAVGALWISNEEARAATAAEEDEVATLPG